MFLEQTFSPYFIVKTEHFIIFIFYCLEELKNFKGRISYCLAFGRCKKGLDSELTVVELA